MLSVQIGAVYYAAALSINRSTRLDHSLDHGVMGIAVVMAAVLLAGRLTANIAIVAAIATAAVATTAVATAATATKAAGEQSHSKHECQNKADQRTLLHNIYLSIQVLQTKVRYKNYTGISFFCKEHYCRLISNAGTLLCLLHKQHKTGIALQLWTR